MSRHITPHSPVYTKRFALIVGGEIMEYGCESAVEAGQRRWGGRIEWQEFRPGPGGGPYAWFAIAGGPADLFGTPQPKGADQQPRHARG